MEYFALFVVLVALWFWADYHYWFEESKWVVSVFVVLVFSIWNNFYNITPEVKAARIATQVEENTPVTTKTQLADGCAIYYYYGYGRKESYTTKFVRCQNAETTTELKYSCGTIKSPRTCTDQIITKDTK